MAGCLGTLHVCTINALGVYQLSENVKLEGLE